MYVRLLYSRNNFGRDPAIVLLFGTIKKGQSRSLKLVTGLVGWDLSPKQAENRGSSLTQQFPYAPL